MTNHSLPKTYVAVSLALTLWLVSVSFGQRLPVVRALNPNEPASPSKDGCGNHPIGFSKSGDNIFFDSHDDGMNAWMNLDGHNVELIPVKTTINYRDKYGT